MGSITSSLFISLDGVIEAPQTWHSEYFDDEMGAAVGALMADTEATLLGRQTYDEFARQTNDEATRGAALRGLMRFRFPEDGPTATSRFALIRLVYGRYKRSSAALTCLAMVRPSSCGFCPPPSTLTRSGSTGNTVQPASLGAAGPGVGMALSCFETNYRNWT